MTFQEKTYTTADLARYAALPENAEKRFELIGGRIVEVADPSPTHAYISDEVYAALRAHVKVHDLGFAFSDSVSYTLSDNDEFIPDASFISKQRQPTLPKQFTTAPNLAVEVVSPSNRPREMLNKVEKYLHYGTQLVWVIYPEERVADVYSQNADGSLRLQKIEAPEYLEGETVLPGFRLLLSSVFPD